MRELKFRQAVFKGDVFHLWYYWGYCGYNDEFVASLPVGVKRYEVEGAEYDVKPSQQYTGLKDKNGKEIYEGDVIQFYDRGNMFDNDLLPCTAMVIMKYAKWYPEPINVKGLRGFEFEGANLRSEQCEVIGNIYENPELLES